MDPNTQCDSPGTLLTETKRLIKKDRRSLMRLAFETDIPFYWLQKFMRGGILAPSVNRIQYLYEKLSGKKLL